MAGDVILKGLEKGRATIRGAELLEGIKAVPGIVLNTPAFLFADIFTKTPVSLLNNLPNAINIEFSRLGALYMDAHDIFTPLSEGGGRLLWVAMNCW